MEKPSGINEKILSSILDLSEMMLTAGAEVSRIEDTISRMAAAYGVSRTDVLTITSSITVSVQTADGDVLTQTRRITSYETDMLRLDRCNDLSRRVCREPLTQDELQLAVAEIRAAKPYPAAVRLFAYFLEASSFAVLFGGSWRDALSAGLCSIPLFFLIRWFRKLRFQRLVSSLLAATTAGICAVLLTRLGVGVSTEKICIGCVILLIPGLAFTASLRDMISGDTISGLLGLCEAVLLAMSIAAGFAAAMWLMGGGI